VNLAPRGADAYRRMNVETRSPLELVVMLYDGVLRHLGEARSAIERRDVPARAEAVSRALAILAELQGTLNISEGGAIAADLDRLYGYIIGRMLDVTAKQDIAAIDEIRKLMTPLRESWAQIAQQGAAPVR
jgi:flagellar protein FliS